MRGRLWVDAFWEEAGEEEQAVVGHMDADWGDDPASQLKAKGGEDGHY